MEECTYLYPAHKRKGKGTFMPGYPRRRVSVIVSNDDQQPVVLC